MQLFEIMQMRGLDVSKRVKVLRHQPRSVELDELLREGTFDIYQSYQSNPVLDCDFIVSFLAGERSRAVFWGVYRVVGRRPAPEYPPPIGLEHLGPVSGGGYHYVLERLPAFDDLRKRLVVDWGKSTLAWHQWLGETNKEVIEILPQGFVREFPGYLDFVLRHEELVEIVSHPEANRTWHSMLGGVAGIYLIVDQSSGRQYVGSAYGARGVLGRWEEYARCGHGGNKQLEELVAADPRCYEQFTFTLLRTLPRTITRAEVIAFEVLYKKKLGSRAFGLNSN